jgi:hypothetical protein
LTRAAIDNDKIDVPEVIIKKPSINMMFCNYQNAEVCYPYRFNVRGKTLEGYRTI